MFPQAQPVIYQGTRRHGVAHISSRHLDSDAGFTLIELMVVLLILAILLAIAIPTFLGVTKSANDRAAQSNLNTAEVNAKAAFQTNNQTYSGITSATLSSAEPSISWTAGPSTTAGQVSFAVSTDGHGIVLAAESASKNCWILVDNTSALSTAAAAVAPYGATPSANPLSGTATAVTVALPSTAGLFYAEVKGGATATSCSASGASLLGVGNSYLYNSSGGFPPS